MVRVVYDESTDITAPDERRAIDRILLLSGGGRLQTMFSMGAVKCLVDNDMFYNRESDTFYFDVISAVSGGTLLLTFIDLATNPHYSYHKREDWYNLYVRAPFYRVSSQSSLPFVWGSLSGSNEKLLLDLLPEYKKGLMALTENTNIECHYNYLDASTQLVSNDHSDIFDPPHNVREPSWYWKRPTRCSAPLTLFGGKGTYDAGATSNIPIASALKAFRPRDTFIICATPRLLYEPAPKQTWLELGLSGISRALEGVGANAAINGLLDVTIDKSGRNLCCSMPNELNDSDDASHRGLITSIESEVPLIVRFYNGALFHNSESLKLIENIGYTQMHKQIEEYCGEGKHTCVFSIPNPDVYDKKRAARIYERLKTINPLYETIVATMSSLWAR